MLAVPAGAKLKAALASGDLSSPTYLLKASISAFGGKLGGPALPKLFLTLFTFGLSSRPALPSPNLVSPTLIPFAILLLSPTLPGQVFLVQNVTRFIADPTIPMDRGWALVGGFVLIYSGISLCTYLYFEKVFAVSVQYRAGLIAALYSKTLRLTSVAAREVGQVS